MKKQLLVIFMITIVLATVFVAGCTGGVTNTTSPSSATSTAAKTSKINATTTRSSVTSRKATTVPTATPSKTPTAHAAGCNFVGDSSTHVLYYARCPCVSKIKPGHKVCFDTAQQALAAGYRS